MHAYALKRFDGTHLVLLFTLTFQQNQSLGTNLRTKIAPLAQRTK